MDIGWSPPATDAERIARLRLYRTRNIGPLTFRRLLCRFGSAEAALAALPGLARSGGLRRFEIFGEADARRELDDLQALGGDVLHLGSPPYPPQLAAAEDAPPVLMALGRTELLSRPAVAIVGARNASANGRTLATGLAADLAGAGYTVVSGMARGIDAAAHAGALAGGTVAVLGGGVDVVYPRENADLYRRIAADGLILSEMPPGLQPQGRHFPRRNRIISGLSLAVVIVEAAERSGSLTTARFAAEQGRDVLAVPGSPLDPRTHGTSRLIREGATLVMNFDHIRESLDRPFPNWTAPRPEAVGKADAPPPPPAATADLHTPLLELIGAEPTLIDEIVRQSGRPSAAVRAALLEMEIAGRIQGLPGNRVVRNHG